MTSVPGCNGTTYEILAAGNGGTAIAKGSTGTLHATASCSGRDEMLRTQKARTCA